MLSTTAKFQFLIGRINTPGSKVTLTNGNKFQFLIGRINTRKN